MCGYLLYTKRRENPLLEKSNSSICITNAAIFLAKRVFYAFITQILFIPASSLIGEYGIFLIVCSLGFVVVALFLSLCVCVCVCVCSGWPLECSHNCKMLDIALPSNLQRHINKVKYYPVYFCQLNYITMIVAQVNSKTPYAGKFGKLNRSSYVINAL